jgi:hypothetical protein
MRHRRPELLAIAWILTGLLLLVATAGVLIATRTAASGVGTPRVMPLEVDAGALEAPRERVWRSTGLSGWGWRRCD